LLFYRRWATRTVLNANSPIPPVVPYYNPLRVWVGAWVGLLEECFLSCVVDGFSFFSVISPPSP